MDLRGIWTWKSKLWAYESTLLSLSHLFLSDQMQKWYHWSEMHVTYPNNINNTVVAHLNTAEIPNPISAEIFSPEHSDTKPLNRQPTQHENKKYDYTL